MTLAVDSSPGGVEARVREAFRRGARERPAKGVRMDAKAVSDRLRQVAELRRLCLSLSRQPSPPVP